MSNLATLIQDVRGDVSSKRVIGLASLAAVLGNVPLALVGHPLPEHLVNVLATFVGGSLFGATAEHFSAPPQKGMTEG